MKKTELATWKCAIISKYLCSKVSWWMQKYLVSYLTKEVLSSNLWIYDDSFEANIFRDDCALSILVSIYRNNYQNGSIYNMKII